MTPQLLAEGSSKVRKDPFHVGDGSRKWDIEAIRPLLHLQNDKVQHLLALSGLCPQVNIFDQPLPHSGRTDQASGAATNIVEGESVQDLVKIVG